MTSVRFWLFFWVVLAAFSLGILVGKGHASGYKGGGGSGGQFDGLFDVDPVPVTLTGTTTASSTHSIDGTGTSFLREVNPGDLVYVTTTDCPTQFPTAITSSLMSMVWSVADDTHMVVSTAIGSGASQTLCKVTSPAVVPMVAPVGCGQQNTLRTDANASTTLDVCISTEDCDSGSTCTPSYALVVNDVVCLETDLATCARVTNIDDAGDQITVSSALGSYTSGTEVAIYVKRIAQATTAFGTTCLGLAWQQKFPLLQSASGSAIQNNATENCWFESKRVQRSVGVLIADIADPPDLILARLGTTGAFPLHTLSAGDALPAGTSIASMRWMGWDGTALSQGAVDGAKTTELWTATAHGAKRRMGRVADGTTTTMFGIELDQDGTVYLGCEDGSGSCEAVARKTCLKKGSDGDASVCFKAPDGLASTYTLEWPADDGTSGQLLSAGLGSGVTTWTSLALTATALAANGANCSAGSYPLGVDASGASESCTVAQYQTVQDEGSGVTQRAILNFAGAGVTCADDTTKTTCTIAGAAGGSIVVEEDNSSVDAAVTNLDFTEPDATIVTSSPAGEANVAMSGYARLAGRSGGQTIQGGTGSGEALTLESTAHATKNDVNVLDRLDLRPSKGAPAADNTYDLNFSPTYTDSGDFSSTFVSLAPTVTASANSSKNRVYIHTGGTLTIGSTTWNAPVYSLLSDFEIIADSNLEAIPATYVFSHQNIYTFKSTNLSGGTITSFNDSPVLRANTASTTLLTGPSLVSFSSLPVLQSTTGGVTLPIPSRIGFQAGDSVRTITGPVTVTSNIGFQVDDFAASSGNYTVTNRYGYYSLMNGGRAFYAAGTADNVLTGNTAIGSDHAPLSDLDVVGNSAFGTSQAAGAIVHIENPTPGGMVERLETTTTADDPAEQVYLERNTTTGAATATLLTKATTNDTGWSATAHFVGHCTGGASCSTDQSWGYFKYCGGKNDGGTATVTNCTSAATATGDNLSAESVTATFDCTAVASSANILFQCTGAANYNVTWHVTVRWMEVGT